MPYAIETFELTKRFPAGGGWRDLLRPAGLGPPAVDRVTLAMQKGELFGVVGPNGAGKTTLIKLLSTLIIPTSGSARVNGYDLSQEMAIRASIGLVTGDERSFYWRLTGRQNLQFFAALHHMEPAYARVRIEEVLQAVDLLEVADRRFQTYSTGMRQRLAIARALLNRPRILFFDEPTRSLDPTATRRLHRLIRERLVEKQGITILMTTHRLEEAEQLCDRVAVIDRGRIRACGSVAELRERLGLRDRYRLLARGWSPAAQAALEEQVGPPSLAAMEGGEALIEFDAPAEPARLVEGLVAARRAGAEVRDISRRPVSMDEIFTRLVESPLEEPSPAPSPPQREEAGQPPPPLSLRDWSRLAWAFLRRDALAEASYRLAFFLLFFGVFFSVTVFYFVARLFEGSMLPYLAPYGGDYFSFVLIGIAFSSYFGVGLATFSSSLRTAQTTGTLEAMLASPTPVSAIILCSSIWSYLMTTLRVLVYLLVGVLFLGVDLGRGNYGVALLILLLTIISLSELGVLAASFIMVVKRGNPVTWIASSLFNLLGGVYYPIAVLPSWLRLLARLLPVTYSLEAMRLALLQGSSLRELWPEVLALGAFSLLLGPVSLWAFRLAVRRAKRDGSLTHY